MARTIEVRSKERGSLAPLVAGFLTNPFVGMRRLSDETRKYFKRLRGTCRRLWRDLEFSGQWIPTVEMLEKKGTLVVRADLPGLSKDDVKVEIIDNDLVIEGERKTETDKEEDGYYTSERSYGSFRRCLALPYGVNADEATATFSGGVLEVTMPARQHQEPHGHRLDRKAS